MFYYSIKYNTGQDRRQRIVTPSLRTAARKWTFRTKRLYYSIIHNTRAHSLWIIINYAAHDVYRVQISSGWKWVSEREISTVTRYLYAHSPLAGSRLYIIILMYSNKHCTHKRAPNIHTLSLYRHHSVSI